MENWSLIENRVIRCVQSIQKTLLVLVKIFLAKNFNSES